MPKTARSEAEQESRDAKLTQSYTMALRWLREENEERFIALRVKAAKQLGIEWVPKPTPLQQAKAEVEARLAEFPELRDLLAPEPPESEG